MPSLEILLSFTLVAVLVSLSPGPSNLYIMARSIAQGFAGGLMAAMGLAVGGLVHVLASALGLAAVFQYSPMAYTLVKVCGAVYLVYLGIMAWRAKPVDASDVGTKPVAAKSRGKIFRESILVEVTNPKTALFFLALLPQFVQPESGPVATQLLVLGLIAVLAALPCDLAIAGFSSKAARWLAGHQQAQKIQERVSGFILIVMGLFIASEEVT